MLGASGVVVALCLIGATTASAATEFGDNCVGTEVTEGTPVSIFAITAPGDPLPLTAPSAGVITQWKVSIVQNPFSFPQTLKVLRQNGPNTVQVIGEATGTITGGTNSFPTRIPVQAGDHVGLFGSSQPLESGGEAAGNLYCETPMQESRIGAFAGGSVGATSPFIEIEEELRVPVSATIEPDADGDGYGDETQDKCPQSATTQAPCPTVVLNTSASAKKGLVTIVVTSTVQASVTVGGKVKLGKGKSAKLNGGTQVVAPGALAKFTVPFTGKLKSALKKLSSKQSLKLKLNASAPNIVGAPTVSKATVKLKGQAKPKRHKKS